MPSSHWRRFAAEQYEGSLSSFTTLLSSSFFLHNGLPVPETETVPGGTASPQSPGRLTIPELNLCLATVRQAKCLQLFGT